MSKLNTDIDCTEDVKLEIHRTYSDTVPTQFATRVECPTCGHKWMEEDAHECGIRYQLSCEECDEEFIMNFKGICKDGQGHTI